MPGKTDKGFKIIALYAQLFLLWLTHPCCEPSLDRALLLVALVGICLLMNRSSRCGSPACFESVPYNHAGGEHTAELWGSFPSVLKVNYKDKWLYHSCRLLPKAWQSRGLCAGELGMQKVHPVIWTSYSRMNAPLDEESHLANESCMSPLHLGR